MDGDFNVVFTGQLRPGTDEAECATGFSLRFGVTPEKAQSLLDEKRERVLKKHLDKDKAERYKDVLDELGMIVRIEPAPSAGNLSLEPVEQDAARPDTPRPDPGNAAQSACPKCGSSRIENDNCLDCGIVISKYRAIQNDDAAPGGVNPYAAPRADLIDNGGAESMTGPVRVPFGHGWNWLARGFWHFRQNPWAWMLSVVVLFIVTLGVSLIPFIGSLVVNLFSPVFMAGFAIGARTQDQGGDFEFSHLFAGFSSNLGQLILVGLIYLLGMILIVFTAVLMFGGAMATLGGTGAFEAEDPAMAGAVLSSPTVTLALLVGLALIIPLIMAYWFAPTLIALEGMSALGAMRLSFVACLKNMLPFLLYGLIATVLLFLAVLPAGLGLLIAMPILAASFYTAYRDIYYD